MNENAPSTTTSSTAAKVELLSPAGSMLKLKTVFRYGADAAYVGGKAFNLRAASSNFNKEELKQAVDYAHSIGKKLYVTLNIIAHNKEIKALPKFVQYLAEIGVDAVIVADLGVLDIVSENSDLKVHISTQSSSTNWRTIKMWYKLGARRVVLARELSLDEIKQIKDQVPEMELEVFVHGSMCMTYSGRCNLSSYMADRDGNRGVCSNTCRWKYHIVEERRPGEYFPVYEDENGSHIYNSRDLCTIEFIDKILEAGVDSLKIEGRMKSILYGAVTTKAYRAAVDSCYAPGGFNFDPRWREELETYSHRGYTSGFFFGQLDKNSEAREGGYKQKRDLVGYISDKTGDHEYVLTLQNKFTRGDRIEVLSPTGEPKEFKIDDFELIDKQPKGDYAPANSQIKIRVEDAGLNQLDIVRGFIN